MESKFLTTLFRTKVSKDFMKMASDIFVTFLGKRKLLLFHLTAKSVYNALE